MSIDLRIRNDAWKGDELLESALIKYVGCRLLRREILSHLKRDFGHYPWSIKTLSTRLAFFDIKFIDYDIPLQNVKDAIEAELNGPGSKLGYRAMTNKVRIKHGFNVPRNLVYDIMAEMDPEGLKERGNVGKKMQPKRKKAFLSYGSNYVMSLDGHDKLCGFQKATFPLCIYGGLDTYTGRMNFLNVWNTNNQPKVVARFYFNYLCDSKVIPTIIRIDRGTETDIMATIQSYLCQANLGNQFDETDCVMHGPSTQNKIERWWRELHHRMETYFKEQLKRLLESGQYDPTNKIHRNMMAFIYIPVVQNELDDFRTIVWNHHRVRKQKCKELPTGVPEHMFQFPEEYGGTQCGISITEEQLVEVAEQCDIFSGTEDYLTEFFRQECERHIPKDVEIELKEAEKAYIFLKSNLDVTKIG